MTAVIKIVFGGKNCKGVQCEQILGALADL